MIDLIIKYKSKIALLLAIVIVYTFLHVIGVGCPIRYFIGISCAGCGMSRAWWNVLHLDFGSAFYYHPLFALVPVMFVFFLLQDRIDMKKVKLFWTLTAILFMLVYLVRLFQPDNTVVGFDDKIIRFIRG